MYVPTSKPLLYQLVACALRSFTCLWDAQVGHLCGLWGAWVAQLVECLTLGFSSGHDLKVMELSPVTGSTLSRVCFKFSLHLSLNPPTLLMHAIILSKINK